ncbi:hypothetical protein HKX48_008326 [Thoreauomyces humboldtii]|nr:hypothetical protein HKX48_008326 [Thoreauomyces humboldtii]
MSSANHVFQHVLERLGYAVEVQVDSHERMFQKQQNGEIDLLLGWLETSHGRYLDAYRDRALVLPNAVYSPYCIWGVPDYIPESVVSSVEDLRKPGVRDVMQKCIRGINPGAGISRFSEKMIEEYGLYKDGYHFRSGTEEECFETFQRAVQKKKWLVIPLWHPQYLHHQNHIRALEDPRNLLGGVDDCRPILLTASIGKLTPEHIAILNRITIGNAAITEMDYYHHKLNLSSKQAALRWIDENQTLVESWFGNSTLKVATDRLTPAS